MKLKYLSMVQAILEDYDFQDKYKVMLDLEQDLTKLESSGNIDKEEVYSILGTPIEFTNKIITKYDLRKAKHIDDAFKPTSNTDELLTATQTSLEEKMSNSVNTQTIDIAPIHNNTSTEHLNIESEHERKLKEIEESSKNNSKKMPIKIIFGILFFIYCITAFLTLCVSIIAAVGIMLVVDVQTAISFFLGVFFLLGSIWIAINLFKNILYDLIDSKFNFVKFTLKVIFIVILGLLSHVLLTSAFNNIQIFIDANLTGITNVLSSFNIDSSLVNWQDFDLAEATKLIEPTIRGVLGV